MRHYDRINVLSGRDTGKLFLCPRVGAKERSCEHTVREQLPASQERRPQMTPTLPEL